MNRDREEVLAQAMHALYLEQRLASGERLGSTPSMVEWEALPQEFRESSRAHARVTQRLLERLGYSVQPARPNELPLQLPEADIDVLARLCHERWVEERRSNGWRLGSTRSDAQRRHPDLVSWEELAEDRREIDRHLVRGLPALLALGGRNLVRKRREDIAGA